jgi:hypothetical protein
MAYASLTVFILASAYFANYAHRNPDFKWKYTEYNFHSALNNTITKMKMMTVSEPMACHKP